jgi:O-antigen ligase
MRLGTPAPPHEVARPAGGKKGSSLLLRLTLLSILVVPSYMLIEPIGASGNLPQLFCLILFGVWLASSAFGLHNPMLYGHPGRAALFLWVVASLASYAAMFGGFSGPNDDLGRSAADRWILLVLASSGLALTVTESTVSRLDFFRTVRWLMAGAAFCSLVAVIQFTAQVNPMEWIESMMPGFTKDFTGSLMMARDGFFRVSGSTVHPIELAVVSSMLLPLSIWWALFDHRNGLVWRISVPTLLLIANLFSVSRTAMIGLVLCIVVFIPFLPPVSRRWALITAPLGVVGIFLAIPGMLGTLLGSATAGSSDSSITHRTGDYPLAWRLFFERPWLGRGPGTWMPTDSKDIFDNQYIQTVTTLGGVGLVALLALFLFPTYGALQAARHAPSQEVRTLSGAIAAAMLVAAVSAGTFDAFSFQTFTFVLAFFVGASGLVWFAAKRHVLEGSGLRQNITPPLQRGESWIR